MNSREELRARFEAIRDLAQRLAQELARPEPNVPLVASHVELLEARVLTAREKFTRSIVVWFSALAFAWLDTRSPLAGATVNADLVAGAAIVIAFLGNLFRGLFSGGVSTAVKRALEGMRDVITDVGEALAKGLRETAMVFGSIWGFFRKFWDRILLPMLSRLDRFVARLFKWLRDTFGPIIAFLQEVRRKFLEFYNKWFRPIFDTIDVLRRMLGLFSLFGLQWARELDRKLAQLEETLMRPIREILLKLNEAIDTVDRIVTGNGLLQRITLLRSYARDVGRIGAIWHAAHSKPLTAEERAASARAQPWRTSGQVLEESQTYIATGAGPQAALISELALDFRQRVSRA